MDNYLKRTGKLIFLGILSLSLIRLNMADQDNGGYRNYVDDGGSDFKRKADPNKDIRVSDDEDENSKAPGMGSEFFIKELLSERVQMDGKYPHADRLLQGGQTINKSLHTSSPSSNLIPPSRNSKCSTKWKDASSRLTIH